MQSNRVVVVALFLIAAGCGGSGDASTQASSKVGQPLASQVAGTVVQVVERSDIVSDLPGAKVQDKDLQNAWGLAFNPLGVAWVSANGTGLSFVFKADGSQAIPAVTIPTPQNGTPPSSPTGQVFNPDTASFEHDKFIFVTEDGTIAGWQGGTTAVLRRDNSVSAIYKGVTIAKASNGKLRLYAANFHDNTVEVYNENYLRLDLGAKSFRDDNLPAGFAPFNVQEINGLVYVTYAKQDDAKHDDVKGAGNGFVDVFDPDGALMSRLISDDALNSPWGLALAPAGFGKIGGRLLVGNFGDGRIHVYDLSAGGTKANLSGALGGDDGKPIVIDGLWALRFGVDAGGFSSTVLYFTAGPNDENDGVFGKLDVASGQAESGEQNDAGVRARTY